MFSRKKKTGASKRGGKNQKEVPVAAQASPSDKVAIRSASTTTSSTSSSSTAATTTTAPKAPPLPNAIPWLLRVPQVPENIKPSKAQRLLSGKTPINENTLSPRVPWILKVQLPTKGKKPSEAVDEFPRKRSKSLAEPPLPWLLRVPLPKLGQPPSQLLKSTSRRKSITTVQEHLRNKPARDFDLPWLLQVPKPKMGQKPSEFKQFKSTCLRNRATDCTLPWILRVPTPKCGEKPSSFRFCTMRRKKASFQLPWILSVPLPKCGQKPSEFNRKKSYIKELPWLNRVPLPKKGERPCNFVMNKRKCFTKPYSLPWLLTVPLPKCGQKPSTFFFNSRRCMKDTTLPWILRVQRAKLGKKPSDYAPLGRKSYEKSLPWLLRAQGLGQGHTPCYFKNKKFYENWKCQVPWLMRVPLPRGKPSEFLSKQRELRRKQLGVKPWILRASRPFPGWRPSLIKQKTGWMSDSDTPWLLRAQRVQPGQKPSDFSRKKRSMRSFTTPWMLRVPRIQSGRKPSDFLYGSRKRKMTDNTLPWILRVDHPKCGQKPSDFLGGSAKRRCLKTASDIPWLLRVPLPFQSVKPSQFRTLYPSRKRQLTGADPLPWITRVPLPKMGEKPSQIKKARLSKLDKGFARPWITRVPLPFIGLRPSQLNRNFRKECLPLLKRVPVFPLGTRPSQMRETRPKSAEWTCDLPWLLRANLPAPNAKPSSIPRCWKQKGKPDWTCELPWLARAPLKKEMIPSKFKRSSTSTTARGLDPKAQLKYLLHPGMMPSNYKAKRRLFKQLPIQAMRYRGIVAERNKTPFRAASSFGKKTRESFNEYGSTNRNYVNDITVRIPSEASRGAAVSTMRMGGPPKVRKAYGGGVFATASPTSPTSSFGKRSQGFISTKAPPPSFSDEALAGLAAGTGAGAGGIAKAGMASAPTTTTAGMTQGAGTRGITPSTAATGIQTTGQQPAAPTTAGLAQGGAEKRASGGILGPVAAAGLIQGGTGTGGMMPTTAQQVTSRGGGATKGVGIGAPTTMAAVGTGSAGSRGITPKTASVTSVTGSPAGTSAAGRTGVTTTSGTTGAGVMPSSATTTTGEIPGVGSTGMKEICGVNSGVIGGGPCTATAPLTSSTGSVETGMTGFAGVASPTTREVPSGGAIPSTGATTTTTTGAGTGIGTGIGATTATSKGVDTSGVAATAATGVATTMAVPSSSSTSTTAARSAAVAGGAAPSGGAAGGSAIGGAGVAAAGGAGMGAAGGAGAGAGGAGAGTGARGDILAREFQESQGGLYDSVIIGGGISGLTAAYNLLQQCPNAKVLVLEGTAQTGGRIKSMSLPSPPCPATTSVDVGATWFGPVHTHMLTLLKQLNIDVYQQYSKGKKIFQNHSKKKLYDLDTTSTLGSLSKFDTSKLYTKVKKLADKLPKLSAKKAADLDNTSFHDWTSSESWTKSSFDSLDLAVEWIFGTTPRNLSTLYALNVINSAGGNIKRMTDKNGGAMSYRAVGGMTKVCSTLCDTIRKAGGEIRFNSLVGTLDTLDNDIIRVGTADNAAYFCKHLIFATPLSSLYKITCNFTVPDEYTKLSMNMFMGSYIRIIAVYKDAFWRDANLSGEAVINASNYQREPISFVIDYSDYQNQVNALCVTITAERAAFWGGKPEPERRAAVLNKLGVLFGSAASTPICYLEYDWNNDPVYKGGTFGIYPPGRNLDYEFSNTYKNIHWAGAETADVWRGFLEGACQSGIRAAGQVATQLKLETLDTQQQQSTVAQGQGQKNVVTEANVQPIVDTVTVGNR